MLDYERPDFESWLCPLSSGFLGKEQASFLIRGETDGYVNMRLPPCLAHGPYIYNSYLITTLTGSFFPISNIPFCLESVQASVIISKVY